MKKVQLAVDAIDAHIETLKKEVADLEACHECLLSNVVGPNHFGDQTLFRPLITLCSFVFPLFSFPFRPT